MDYRSLHAKTVADLRQIGRSLKVKFPVGTTKARMIEMILEHFQAEEAANAAQAPQQETAKSAPAAQVQSAQQPAAQAQNAQQAVAEAEPQREQASKKTHRMNRSVSQIRQLIPLLISLPSWTEQTSSAWLCR